MNKLLETIGDLFEHSILYVKTSFASLKAGFVQSAAQTTSVITLVIVSFTTICFFLFFVAVGLSFWIGKMVNNYILGFLITSSLFGVIAVTILLLSKKGFIPFLRNKIVSIIYKNKNSTYAKGRA